MGIRMMIDTLENEYLAIKVSHRGAELCSLMDKEKKEEYLWSGDPAFWGGSSPVLFPFIGGLQDGKFRHDGKEYAIIKHGFAKDMDFTLLRKEQDCLWYGITDTGETRKSYPFAFVLEIGYLLRGKTLSVRWRVFNKNDKTMYFSIGGHPGFVCPPPGETGLRTQCSLQFDEKERLVSEVIGADGLISGEQKSYPLQNGRLPVSPGIFDRDALLFKNGQVHRVSLCGKDGRPYVSVSVEAPVVGIWSREQEEASFICVEPWHGICDTSGYAGELKDRPFINCLDAGQTFEAGYKIFLEEVE